EYELLVYLQYTQDDNDRNNDTIHQTLIVTNAEPLANIQVNQVGSIFHFSNASAQPSDTYLWDFGDGNTSTEANPSHEYAQTQQYLVTLIVTGFCGSDTATVEVDGVSIQENYLQKEIAVYPNPTNQMLHLKLGTNIQAEFFTVYNVLGQEVLSGSLVQTHQINVSHLAGGSYVIQIKTNKGNVSKQFQVVR